MLPIGGYKSKDHESEILKRWMESGSYKPEFNPKTNSLNSASEMKNDPRESWALICPPPNAYGRPHIGNISGYAYMDAMARYQRMKGKKVLVLPGKDHAGLEGEGVFVKEVLEKQKRYKFDMKREDFYQEMMDWFGENMKQALKDEQEIGLSGDFERNTFTLDPDIVETVLDTFVEMYDKKMIYKGVRIINYDIKARTAVADNQIEYKDSETPFFYFKYVYGEPVKEAIEMKNKFANMQICEFEIRDKKKEKRKEGDDDKNFLIGEITSPQPSPGGEGEQPGIIAIGFDQTEGAVEPAPDSAPGGPRLRGKVIGVEMRLDNKFRLVVVNPDFTGDIDSEIFKVFQILSKEIAGDHIIKFDEPDNKFTNGFVIGTVRPETVFADTAIACDPRDERYKEFVGKEIEVEFLGEKKKLNFIEDFAVDKDFGTGLLKVTPAHATEDWEIAGRHPEECLPAIQVINFDLTMNNLAGKYSGMRIKEAREAMREDMKVHGNLVYVDDHYKNRIAIAERTKAPIEPLLSSQWYLKYDGIKEAAIQMVLNAHDDRTNLDLKEGEKAYDFDQTQNSKLKTQKLNQGTESKLSGKGSSSDLAVRIHPASMVPKFNNWMGNLRDWAISRSLWWGYRLPVWYHGEVKEEIGEDGLVREMIKLNSKQDWTELEYDNPDHLRVQKESPGDDWLQDEDVLDTWFSSGQWVYATLRKYGLMETFFPSDVLVSAYDILENWDSRMMMFTYFKEKNIPFKNLFLTGLVKASDGQKMSKSKGNVMYIDDLREKYGTDSVRMVFFYQNSAGGDYAMTYEKLDTFKKFINKIWNATNFVMMNIEDLKNTDVYDLTESDLKLENSKKLLNHIEEVRKHITKNIDEYEFGLATYNLYHEFWHTYCDIFLETSKPYVWLPSPRGEGAEVEDEAGEVKDPVDREETQRVLLYALKTYLKLLHPFIPFVTQRLWDELPKEESDHEFLMYSKW